jgi:hypothetical protein
VKLALWAPAPLQGLAARVADALALSAELVVVTAEPRSRPEVDLDLYHVANDAAHAFVYRGLLERPGLVVLENWGLHALVFAATAASGAPAVYLCEARRERGETGAFIARQVLRGLGGALAQLLLLNGRVLDASVALMAASEDVRARAAAGLGGRPARSFPPPEGSAPDARTSELLLELAREAVVRLPAHARALAEQRALDETLRGRALLELRPAARELGLLELPRDAAARITALLPGSPGRPD